MKLAASQMLEGVRVLELAEWGLVPACGAVLADLGADVIKIERPDGGDVMRRTGHASAFEQYNRGKRSLALDLADATQRGILLKLVSRVDVFLTSLRPERRARLGVDAVAVRSANPRLIDASASAAGPSERAGDLPGFSSIAQWARGGIAMALTPPQGPYVYQPAGFPDAGVATTLACGIAAALFRRSQTGTGCGIDVSMLGMAVWQMALELIDTTQRSTRGPENPLTAAYRCADDRIVVISLRDDRQWPALCAALDIPDLAADARFSTRASRHENRVALRERLEDAFASRDSPHWSERLTRHGCTWGAAQTLDEVRRDPLVGMQGLLQTRPESADAMLVATPISFDGRPPQIQRRAPRLGEHSAEILSWLERGGD